MIYMLFIYFCVAHFTLCTILMGSMIVIVRLNGCIVYPRNYVISWKQTTYYTGVRKNIL